MLNKLPEAVDSLNQDLQKQLFKILTNTSQQLSESGRYPQGEPATALSCSPHEFVACMRTAMSWPLTTDGPVGNPMPQPSPVLVQTSSKVRATTTKY